MASSSGLIRGGFAESMPASAELHTGDVARLAFLNDAPYDIGQPVETFRETLAACSKPHTEMRRHSEAIARC